MSNPIGWMHLGTCTPGNHSICPTPLDHSGGFYYGKKTGNVAMVDRVVRPAGIMGRDRDVRRDHIGQNHEEAQRKHRRETLSPAAKLELSRDNALAVRDLAVLIAPQMRSAPRTTPKRCGSIVPEVIPAS